MEEIAVAVAMEVHTQLEVVAVVVLTGGVVRYVTPMAVRQPTIILCQLMVL